MEVEALKLLIAEEDINALLSKFLRAKRKVAEVRVEVLSEGIKVSGIYQAIVRVPFETLWSISICGGKIAVCLVKMTAGKLGISFGKETLLKTLASRNHAIKVEGETILFDVDLVLAQKGIPLRTNLAEVHCRRGHLIIESKSSSAER